MFLGPDAFILTPTLGALKASSLAMRRHTPSRCPRPRLSSSMAYLVVWQRPTAPHPHPHPHPHPYTGTPKSSPTTVLTWKSKPNDRHIHWAAPPTAEPKVDLVSRPRSQHRFTHPVLIRWASTLSQFQVPNPTLPLIGDASRRSPLRLPRLHPRDTFCPDCCWGWAW